jgi:hypothetical protein
MRTAGSRSGIGLFYTGWANAATAHGFAAINADTHTDGVADDFDALAAHLREHASELKVDADRIGVYAASGNASRRLPIIEDRKRNWIKAAAIYYGSAEIEQFRPEIPLLWIRAGLDRPQWNRQIDEAVAKAMRQNVTVAVVNFAGGHHGFEVIDDNDAGRDAIEQTFQFFKRSLDPSWRAAMASGRAQAEAAGAVASGDYERAASIYAQLIDESSSATTRLAYGEALLGAKRYRDARAQFDRERQLGGLGPRWRRRFSGDLSELAQLAGRYFVGIFRAILPATVTTSYLPTAPINWWAAHGSSW